MGLRERILQYISYEGITVQMFENKAMLSNGAVSKMGDNTRRSTLDKISNSFPNLNINWLITGEGKMCNEVQERNVDSELPHINYSKGVPYYNVDFIGGFDIVLNDQTTVPEYLIDFKKYNEATCWCNVTGHSMEPEITHGDIIALKRIEDFSFLPFGEVYAIVTRNGMRTIKRIGPSENVDCYSLIPTNKSLEYGVQDLRKDMIEIVYQVLGCMKRL